MNRAELLSLNLELLRDRLVRLGWRTDDEDKALLFTPDDQTAFIPFDEPDNSKVLALESIFGYLAKQQDDTHPETIIAMAAGGQDVVKLGLDFPNRLPGRLPLGMSREFYGRWEGFFAQTAAAETNFNPKGTRKLPGDASRLVSSSEWGQTSPGSFLHALHIPLSHTFEPLGRRTWHRMFRCIATIEDAVQRDSIEPIISLGETGWTAPMCEMMAEVVLQTGATSVKAKALPDVAFDSILPDAPTEVEVSYTPEHLIEILSNASLSLRGLLDPQKTVVTGLVFALADPTIVGDDRPKTIRILWRQEGGNDIRVNVELNERDYAVAEQAYFNRRRVQVIGLLTSRGTRYWLSEPQGLVFE